MNNTQLIDVQVLPPDSYTTKELRLILSKYRRKKVPPRTLRYWTHQIGLRRNGCGLFDSSDLEILIRLVRWLSRGGNIQQFRLKLMEEMSNAT